jgi:hypothetical protein
MTSGQGPFKVDIPVDRPLIKITAPPGVTAAELRADIELALVLAIFCCYEGKESAVDDGVRTLWSSISERLETIRVMPEEGDPHQRKWVLYSPAESKIQGEPVYWSNDHGWGDLDSATRFNDEEKGTMDFPVTISPEGQVEVESVWKSLEEKDV